MKHPFSLSENELNNRKHGKVTALEIVTDLEEAETHQVAGGLKATTLALGLGEAGDTPITLAYGIGEGGTTPSKNPPMATMAYSIGENGGGKPTGTWFNRFWGW